MRKSLALLAFVFLGFFFISFVSAECETWQCEINLDECLDIGEVYQREYCSNSGILSTQGVIGESCLNDFECFNSECIERVCANKADIITSEDVLSSENLGILNMILGRECIPNSGEDGLGFKCVGELLYTCGDNWRWEGGVSSESCGADDTDDENGADDDTTPDTNPPGSRSMNLVIVSPANVTYSSSSISLKVYDVKKRAGYFRYSLNGGSKIEFVPNITISARVGSNKLEVFSSRSSSFSNEQKRTVEFSVVLSSGSGFCGDGSCGIGESQSSCSADCGVFVAPVVEDLCGDNTCDRSEGESSATCPEDCESSSNYIWWIILVVVIFLIMGAIVFIIIKVNNKNYKKGRAVSSVKSLGAGKPGPEIKPNVKPIAKSAVKPSAPVNAPTINSILKSKPVPVAKASLPVGSRSAPATSRKVPTSKV